jgi:MFS superfamily sulfate permease-like transporter
MGFAAQEGRIRMASTEKNTGALTKFLSPVTDQPVSYARELLASVVVFLVALPLCMGIAIASGVPPALGLITGMIGGLVVGSMGGAPLLVSGPAAGLAVLVWQFVERFGVERLGVVVFASGVIQLVCGVSKLGRWFRAVSPAVIHGMLAGIGLLILSSQFHVMVDDSPRDVGWKNLLTIPVALRKGLVPQEGAPMHHLAAGIGLLTLVILVGWNLWRRPKALRAVPGPLVAVVVATTAQAALGWDIKHVNVPESLLESLNTPRLSAFASLLDPNMLGAILAFAVIASAETLLSAAAVDKMHGGKPSNYDRELAAQGFGNALCGLLGALPMTGVIVRSTANIEAGARTRMSTLLHGLWLLGFVAALPFALRMIPTASLAAVLVYTGYKLVDPKIMRELYRVGKGELAIYLVTLIGIVATDLLIGVLLGVAAALLKLIYHFTRLDIVVDRGQDPRRVDVRLFGAATFVQLPRLAAALEGLDRDQEVHVHLGGVAYIDHSSLNLLREFERTHRDSGSVINVDWDESAAQTSSRPLADAGREKIARDVEHGR